MIYNLKLSMVNASKKKEYPQEVSGVEAADSAKSATPMMQQYINIKKDHPNHMLFYRMGDFYELFLEDAIIAAKELGIVLTKRGKTEGEDIPMCGVPHHSYESYLNRLINKGFKVAICEQVETPEQAKKERGYKAVVKREVVRIVTQGTITEEKLLDSDFANNLASLNSHNGEDFQVSWCDISTGILSCNNVNKENLISEFERISPSEIIISDELVGDRSLKNFINQFRKILTSQNKSFFNANRAKEKIKNYFKIKDLNSIKDIDDYEIEVIGALIEYIDITQINDKPNLELPKSVKELNYLEIDSSSFRNLEIFRTNQGEYKGSFLNALNDTKTSGGSRLLQGWIARPLRDLKQLNERLECVELFIQNTRILDEVRNVLSKLPDVERVNSRVFTSRGTPKDLGNLRDGLACALKLSEIFTFANLDLPNLLKSEHKNLSLKATLLNDLKEALVEFPIIVSLTITETPQLKLKK